MPNQIATENNPTVVRTTEDLFVLLLPDGTYRIGITGLTAIAKPKCAAWNKAVNDALSVQDDEEFEDALYSLMKP